MKDLRAFTGGLDYDSDYRLVAPTDYVDAINVTTGTSAKGSLKNMFGNVEINYTLPDGDNLCIGSVRNIKANSIIYFVFNSLKNHSILEYMCETKTIEPILTPVASIPFTTEFLGFTSDHKIHSANVIDDILLWTDNNVSPRKINIKRAKDFLAQLPPSSISIPYDNLIATGTTAEKIQFIESIKYKPFVEPDIALAFDPTRKTNYIRDKMIQAKYRYIYDDNEFSRWSDGSYVSTPADQENINGPLFNPSANNYLQVFVNTGHPTVKGIEVAFRFGNLGVWGKVDFVIQKYDENNNRILQDYATYKYDFYNDSVLIELAEDFNNYDAVPLLSKTQEIIDENRLVYANNLEGYQNPELDVELSYKNTYTSMGPLPYTVTTLPGPWSWSGIDIQYYNYTSVPFTIYPRGLIYIPSVKPSYISVGSILSMVVQRSDDPNFSPSGPQYLYTYDVNYVFTQDDIDNWPTSAVNNIVKTIWDVTSVVAGVASYIYTPNPSRGYYIQIGGLQTNPTGEYTRIPADPLVLPVINKLQSFKKGAWHTFGIVYKDRQGRDGGVATNLNCNVYNPYTPEIVNGGGYSSANAFISSIDFQINHNPPEWAYEYEIVYALNNLKKYTQFVIKGANTRIDSNGNISIDCNYIIDYITKEKVSSSVDFQFEVGDLLRFIANSSYYTSQYVEVKVLAFDTTTNILTVTPYSISQVMNGLTGLDQEGVLCELFAYKDQTALDNRPYFAIGETYPIITSATGQKYHGGNTQNQSGAVPAIVSLDRGDCYIYRRYFKNRTISRIIESENFSDCYASQNIDISSVYAVIPEGKTKRYEQGLRYGGRYYPNTNINNILQFNGEDYDTLNTRYGPINKIATVGYVLKVLQTKKNTSIYINRSMIYNANGDQQLSLIDKVLGSKNPSELDYGCEHPESVCVDDRQLYFFDVNNGAYIQDSSNGMVPVSEYKAKTYFRNLADKIKNSPYVYVYSGVDNFNNYINVTFIDHSESPLIEDQTIAYHPIDNRWKSRMSYFPEYYGSNALVFVSFMNGKIYEHNRVDAPRCNYYGTQHSMKVKLVSNQNYPKVKVYTSIAVYADKTFSSPNLGDISIEPSVNYPNGMKSRLVEAKWRWKEGVLYAQYLRDGLTPNFPTVDEAIMGGRKLRGETLIQQIENTDTEEATLYSVIVHGVDSELSK
jgi:hypothetical protein